MNLHYFYVWFCGNIHFLSLANALPVIHSFAVLTIVSPVGFGYKEFYFCTTNFKPNWPTSTIVITIKKYGVIY